MIRSKTISLVLIGIVLGSVFLGIGSNQYYSAVAERIREASVGEIKLSTQVIGHTIALSVKNKLETVTSNLQILAGSPAMNAKWLDRGLVLMNSAQSATDAFTDEYIWAAENGTILQSVSTSRGNPDSEGTVGASISSTEFFSVPKETGEAYLAGYSLGSDGVARVYLSFPIIGASGEFTDGLNPTASGDTTSTFKGVVTASIELASLSGAVSESSSPSLHTISRLLDKNGVVLVNESIPEFVGKNWFDNEIQSSYYPDLVPIEQKDEFNQFNRDSARTATPSSIDIIFSGSPATVVSHPIVILDSQIMTLFTRVPHTLPATTLAVIEEQRLISTTIVMGIIAGAGAASFALLSWNARLQKIVRKRTLELEAKTRTLNEANEELQKADRAQKEFINVAAHELRTPTQAILGYTEVLQNDSIPSGPEDIQAIARNALRLQRLTEDILDVTRIEGGRLVLHREKFPIDDVIQSVIKDVTTQKLKASVRITYEPKGIVIEADRERIAQVIQNLLSNALKFTQAGEVRIATSLASGIDDREAKSSLAIDVTDTGAGIDSDIFPRLFSKFATKSEKGTGLGLFIARSIVEAHGGTITAANNENGGATFSIKLPISIGNSEVLPQSQLSRRNV